MSELYRSAHQFIEYYPEYSLIKRVLVGQREKIKWPELQREWLEYASLVLTHKPEKILVDATQFDFLLLKEMQEWINRHVINIFNNIKLKKWAILIPPQFLNQVGIEQTVGANPHNTFEARYFESEYEALVWLQINHWGSLVN